MQTPVLEVEDLTVRYKLNSSGFAKGKKHFDAVRNVSFSIDNGECVGLVGESGCGKSTLGRSIVRLLEPHSGSIRLHGREIAHAKGKELLDVRRDVQMIFQDPYASINPRLTVEDTVVEPLIVHKIGTSKEKKARVREVLDLVGLPTASLVKYPHEFSGGQRQRIGIARAIVSNPSLLICDEPVSALDVSIQSQVLNLLKDIQEETQTSLLFISHDLSVVEFISRRVCVMYLGEMIEKAPKDELFSEPIHPYTQALLSAVPISDPEKQRSRERIILRGEIPSPITPPSGCAFRTRCPSAVQASASVQIENFEPIPGRVVSNCPCVLDKVAAMNREG